MCLAVPGLVLSLGDEDPLCRTARVAFLGVVKVINVAFVPQVKTDDYVLVHAGVAITVLDATAALETIAHWQDGQEGEEVQEGSKALGERGDDGSDSAPS